MSVAWNADVDLTLEAAFGDGAKVVTPSWEDISVYLTDAKIRRGRSNERDRVQAGTLDLILDNSDRRFDPVNTTGPYSPDVVPAVPVRLRAVHNAITYDLFRGTISAWPMVWPDPAAAIAFVNVHADDDFKLLAQDEMTGTEVLEKSGVRIGNMLDTISWPAARRSLDTGIVDVVGSSFDCVNPIQEIQKVVDTELGLFFMDGAGDAVFQDQNHRAGVSIGGVFSDNPTAGELFYADLNFTYDDTQIWNAIEGTRAGSTATRAADDSASITAYGKRFLKLNELLVTNDSNLQTIVDVYLARYKDPGIRAQTLVIKPERDPVDLWPEVLGAEISDKYTVERDPPGGGTPTLISQDVFVEHLEHNITPSNWVTTWQLSPA